MNVHKIYYSVEFVETVSRSLFGKAVHSMELISIGMTDNQGRKLYCINSDFDVKQAWDQYTTTANRAYPSGPRDLKVYGIRNTVLRPLFENFYKPNLSNLHGDPAFTRRNMQKVIDNVGKPVDMIAQQIREFIYAEAVGNGSDCLDPADRCINDWLGLNRIELVAESGDYNHVLLAGIFGTRQDWPIGLPAYTTSLHQKMNRLTELHEKRLLHEEEHSGLLMEELQQEKFLHHADRVPLGGHQSRRLFKVAASAGYPINEEIPNVLIDQPMGKAIREWPRYGPVSKPFNMHPDYPQIQSGANTFERAQYVQQVDKFLRTE